MSEKILVTANVDSEKFGKGQMSVHLSEDEHVEYNNLNESDKLDYLRGKDAEFKVNVSELSDEDVKNFSIQETQTDTSLDTTPPKISRKIRMNINGNDTGWVEVNDENEAQYNQMIEQFNDMHRQFNDRFKNFFSHGPGDLLDFGFPSLDSGEDKNKIENEGTDT